MKVVVLGAGNVATHLSKAFYDAEVTVTQIWSYHYENAVKLADEVEAVAIRNLSEIDLDADICLVSVKDDAIAGLLEALQNFNGIIAHTSGSVGMDVFNKSHKSFGVFYPLQTFSKDKKLAAEIPFCIEANSAANLKKLREIANLLSDRVLEIDSEKRKILHLAAVFACNFTNHLYAIAEEVLNNNGIDFDIIRPLITETASKVQEESPLRVQTGPAIRGDEQTLTKQEALLAHQPELLEIYKTLSKRIKKTRS